MDPNAIQGIPAGMMTILGLIQLGIIVWIFVFPVLILKKLNEIIDILKERKD
ncbi:MAG: hypothetical protein ISS47_08915 [Candidatus Omnitrophica bacterium]|nr:hypothetical protein [Candidatus Omnitrophota bacterium]